jgi:hypothetical protein
MNARIYEVLMSNGGKGSRPRPKSVSQQEYDTRWDAIFGRDLNEDNTGTNKNEYQDVLSTEDCIVDMPGTMGSAKLIFKE